MPFRTPSAASSQSIIVCFEHVRSRDSRLQTRSKHTIIDWLNAALCTPFVFLYPVRAFLRPWTLMHPLRLFHAPFTLKFDPEVLGDFVSGRYNVLIELKISTFGVFRDAESSAYLR